MSTRQVRSLGLIAGGILITIFVAGCFQTALNLGSDVTARVDTSYCGDWTIPLQKQQDGQETKSATLSIRNFDGKHYYIEWNEPGQKPLRMSGFIAPVKSANFAQLTELGEDGKNSDHHIIVRIELADSKLTIRHLNDKFFEGVTTDEQLRAKVEANLDTAEMYDETMTGTRAQ